MEYNQLLKLEKALNLKIRYKAIFLFLLRSEDFVSSKIIAQKLGVTSRTVKSDIQQLRGSLPEGYIIKSYKSKGYKLEIINHQLKLRTNQFYKTLQPATLSNEFEGRVKYIIRKLLVSKSVTQDDLLAKLYITSVYKELEQAKKVCELYNLKLRQSSSGYFIEGESVNKMLLMLRMYNNFNEINLKFQITNYEKYFEISKNEFSIIENVFFATLTKSEIVFSDLHAKRLIIGIILAKNSSEYALFSQRLNTILGNKEIGKREKDFINSLLFNLSKYSDEFEFGLNKKNFLVFLSIISTDLYRFIDLSHDNYGGLIQTASNMVTFIDESLNDKFGFNLKKDATCYKDLNKLMVPIALKSYLKVSDDLDIAYFNVEPNYKNKVIYRTIETIAGDFYGTYNYLFSTRDLFMISNIVEGYFTRVKLPETQFNVGIIAINGRLSTQQLKNNLQNNYGYCINKITTLPLYQFEDSMKLSEKIDYFFCMEYGKNIPIDLTPIHFVSDNLSKNDIDPKIDFIFKKQMIYKRYLPKLNYASNNDTNIDNELSYVINTSNLKIVFQRDKQLSLSFYKDLNKHALLIKISEDTENFQLKLIFDFIDSITDLDKDIASSIKSGVNYTDFLIN